MVLIFGGTTEGRTAVRVLDEAGTPYYYSTKSDTQQIECKHGTRVAGGMDTSEMQNFCTRMTSGLSWMPHTPLPPNCTPI